MKPSKSKTVKILIGILCVLLLAGVVTLALYLDSLLPNPVFGVFDPHPDSSEEDDFPSTTPPVFDTGDDQPVLPPDDLPSSVVLPTAPDPETGASVVTFPCEVPGYQLQLERLAPYNGLFVESGTNVNVENVAMLLVRNQGEYHIEYAQNSWWCRRRTANPSRPGRRITPTPWWCGAPLWRCPVIRYRSSIMGTTP